MTEHDQLIADALRLIGRTIAALTEMERKLEGLKGPPSAVEAALSRAAKRASERNHERRTVSGFVDTSAVVRHPGLPAALDRVAPKMLHKNHRRPKDDHANL